MRRVIAVTVALATAAALTAVALRWSASDGSVGAYGSPDRPFARSSPWNQPIRGGVGTPLSPAQRSELSAEAVTVNSTSYSVPVYQARPSDPMATVTDPGSVSHYRIPAGAQPAAGSDAHMVVITPDGRAEDECWLMHALGPTSWACGYHARVELDSSGVADGVRASSASALGGLLRGEDLTGAPIRHALAVALPGSALRPGWVAPATSEDGQPVQPYTGHIPMGTRLMLAPGTPIAQLGLDPVGTAVATALLHYGGYVVDESESMTLYAQPSSPPEPIDALRGEIGLITAHLQVAPTA